MQEYQNLVKSGESSDLGTAIQNLINDNLRFINTAFLAKIVKINTKMHQWELIKLKNFCTAKETIKINENTMQIMEKIFVNNFQLPRA